MRKKKCFIVLANPRRNGESRFAFGRVSGLVRNYRGVKMKGLEGGAFFKLKAFEKNEAIAKPIDI